MQFLIWVIFFPLTLFGQSKSVEINSAKPLLASRWASTSKPKIASMPPRAQEMAFAKQAFQERNYLKCAQSLAVIKGAKENIRPWLERQRLLCAMGISDAKVRIREMDLALRPMRVSLNSGFYGPHREFILKTFVSASMTLMQESLRSQRRITSSVVDDLLGRKGDLDDDQEAQLFQAAGELAAAQQNFPAARQYFLEALEIRPSDSLRDRIQSIEMRLKLPSLLPQPAKVVEQGEIEADPEETALFNRMELAEKQGNLVAAVEDGVQVIQKFSGGARAERASERIRLAYLGVLAREGESFNLIRARMKKEMIKVRGARLLKWAESIFNRGAYADSLELLQAAVENFEDPQLIISAHFLAAQAASFLGKNDKAREYYEYVVTRSAGTPMQKQALLRLAFVNLREKQSNRAVAIFEKLIAMKDNDDILTPLYWLWRSYQMVGQNQANEIQQRLIKEFPFSYYGLRARVEAEESKTMKREVGIVAPLKMDLWLASNELQAYERFKILLEAGWFQEAQRELLLLNLPEKNMDALTSAWLCGRAMDHFRAISIMTNYLEENPSDLNFPYLDLAFPTEFQEWIEAQAKIRAVNPDLVLALIKQESSFRTDVESPARARGLMQLVPVTANEVATDLGEKQYKNIDDMMDPKMNIRFGTYYLAKLIRGAKGNLPVALASYNSGPGNISRWIQSRWRIDEFRSTQTSKPEHEIWIEELPWAETTFYVKAVLRNFIIYSLLRKGQFVYQDPIWTTALVSSTK